MRIRQKWATDVGRVVRQQKQILAGTARGFPAKVRGAEHQPGSGGHLLQRPAPVRGSVECEHFRRNEAKLFPERVVRDEPFLLRTDRSEFLFDGRERQFVQIGRHFADQRLLREKEGGGEK